MSSSLKKILRWLLFPISIIYGVVVYIRNIFYNKGWFKSTKFSLPIISVGNISVGGTGKSPMVIYLAKLLSTHNKVSILSRGYKRSSKGFVLYNKKTSVQEIGDEPMQFAMNLTDINVAVCEDRVAGVKQLLNLNSTINCIILDDALQHRKITASCNVVLVDYNDPFFNDFYLPTGNLRDAAIRLNDASAIVITKCNPDLTKQQALDFAKKIKYKAPLFFSCIQYLDAQHLFTKQTKQINTFKNVLLVTGIANPKSIEQYVKSNVQVVTLKDYNDHFNFQQNDVSNIIQTYKDKNFDAIITTQKDAVKLIAFQELATLPIYELPISIQFLFDEQPAFDSLMLNHVQSF
jgi:tetraacyldisaccharide 4'-kinase